MTKTIVLNQSLESFFADLVRDALAAERMQLSDASKTYLLHLVTDFGQSEALQRGAREDERGTPALFRLYERALASGPREQFDAYRHLGDVALFVSGFFAPHVERSLVSVDYYVNMGCSAYTRASVLDRSGAFAPLLSQLAGCFKRLVEVLTRVAERTTIPIARDVAALYERFVRNPGSEELRRRLLSAGAVPVLGAAGAA